MKSERHFWQDVSFEQLDTFGLGSTTGNMRFPYSKGKIDAVEFNKDERDLLIKIRSDNREEILEFLLSLPVQSFRGVCKTVFELYKDCRLTTLSKEKLAPLISVSCTIGD